MFPEFGLALAFGSLVSFVVVVIPFLVIEGALTWQNKRKKG